MDHFFKKKLVLVEVPILVSKCTKDIFQCLASFPVQIQ